jgi:catalase
MFITILKTIPIMLTSTLIVATNLSAQPSQTPVTGPTPSPAQLVDALNGVFGSHAQMRGSHAKGLCAMGTLSFTPQAAEFTNGPLFKQRALEVRIRLSVGGGNPNVSDKSRSVRGLSLRVSHEDQAWDWALISEPVFFAATPESFVKFLQARTPDPITKKIDAAKISAHNIQFPDGTRQPALLAKHAAPASYATTPYFSTHAFGFVNGGRSPQWARLVLQPESGSEYLSEENEKSFPDKFLKNELSNRLEITPARFTLFAQLPHTNDSLVDSSQPWQGPTYIPLAQLSITQLASDDTCDNTMYVPTLLPLGMVASDDPVLKARAAAYTESFVRRATPIK